MSSSSQSGHVVHGGRALFLLAVVASCLGVVTSVVDCQTSSASPSPAPSPSSNSNPNSTFRSNVVALLDALPSAAAPTGFASLSRGSGTDRAFVRGMCRGDSAPGDCATYLQSAVRNITSLCNDTTRRPGIWFDKCFVSYADTNASNNAHEQQQYRSILYNVGKVGNEDAFEISYYALMRRLAARIVNGSGGTSSSSLPSAPMFATGQAVYDAAAPNGTMYGLLQCMRDGTAAECDQCLQDSIRQLPGCCYGNQGGVMLGYNCNLRVEIYTYYNLALDAPPPLALAPAPSSFINRQKRGKKVFATALAIGLPIGTLVAAVVIIGVFLYCKKAASSKKTPPDNNNSNQDDGPVRSVPADFLWEKNTVPAKKTSKKRRLISRLNRADIGYVEPEQLNLVVLRAATNNFSERNKLREGGFGEVFKGTLQDGEEIAVKRLSQNSSQGFHELKNEIVLATKLEHRNLVRLLGVSLQQEKLLIYEYMPNRSLDTFLYDPVKRLQLYWSRRFAVINGIARGLLYLHEESRLKVIHRDLKPSNVLLDADMNPKISDFGIARAFGGDQSRDITRRPVGTLGYMAPEYAYWGHVSSKSDMFSFGVIVLEMVTGRRNNSAYVSAIDPVSVLSHVWDKWRTGSTADVVDPLLAESGYPEFEVLTCIEVGLLCVQENPVERQDASTVVLMLSNPTTTPEDRRAPSRPAFIFSSEFSTVSDRPGTGAWSSDQQPSMATVSENDVSISELQPR